MSSIRVSEEGTIGIVAIDSMRALSLAESHGWAKIPGLPEGTPDHVVADMGRKLDPKTGFFQERALLCGPVEDIPHFHLVFYIIEEGEPKSPLLVN